MTAARRCTLVVAASAAVAVAALAPDAAAKAKKPKPASARILAIQTPLGLQGTAGAGGNVVVPFIVADMTGRLSEIEAQYGIDVNADGTITDDEYRPATEDRFDPRDTRRNGSPQLYPTGTDAGAANAFVWKSLSDVGMSHVPLSEYALTPQGRYIPDPDNPGAFLFARGPSGNTVFGGVTIRLRTVQQRRKHRPALYGEWTYTDAFVLDNRNTPSLTIDSVASGSPVVAHWTVFDADSEDLNGNGQLDIAGGEDINGNGVLDCEQVGVAFDWHFLYPGEDPSSMTDDQLAALRWFPCTRFAGVGDTDSLDARPGVPIPTTGALAGLCSAPPGVGRHWTFAWDLIHDVGPSPDGFILRATPFDETRKRGATVYSRTIVFAGP